MCFFLLLLLFNNNNNKTIKGWKNANEDAVWSDTCDDCSESRWDTYPSRLRSNPFCQTSLDFIVLWFIFIIFVLLVSRCNWIAVAWTTTICKTISFNASKQYFLSFFRYYITICFWLVGIVDVCNLYRSNQTTTREIGKISFFFFPHKSVYFLKLNLSDGSLSKQLRLTQVIYTFYWAYFFLF